MPFNIDTAFLSDEESERITAENPHINIDPEKYCPTCHKRGTYVWQGKSVTCNCAQQLQLHKHYLAAGIGLPYQRLDWADYDEHRDEVLWSQLGKYLGDAEHHINLGTGLFFSGDHGLGKTLLVTLILKEFVKSGYQCFATTFEAAVQMFAAGFNDDDKMTYFQRKVIQSRVLLLDDLDKVLKGLGQSTLDSVLRQRVQKGRVTFITTNTLLAGLEVYGSAVLSLLQENSICYEFAGTDFRSQARSRTKAEKDLSETRPIF